MCTVIEESFYYVRIELVNSLWRRKAQIGALIQQFVKMVASMIGIFSIIVAIMLLNLNYLYISIYTVNNSAQDMKRSFEGDHFL